MTCPIDSTCSGALRRSVLAGILLWFVFGGPGVSPDPLHGQSGLYGRMVKEIRIDNLRYTRRDLVLRELASKEGEPYLEENASKDLERLDRLRVFSSYEIRPVEVDGGVVLNVIVRETYPILPALSIDVKDEEGFSVGPAVQFINFRGRAMKVTAAARFGGATTAKLSFENPWYSGNRYPFEFDFHQRDRPNKIDDFRETSSELGFRVGRWLGKDGRAGVLFRFLSLGSDTPGVTLSPDNRDNVPTLGLYLGYDSRDLWSNPRRGWRGEFEFARNGSFLGGDGNWWSFSFDVRRYQPIRPRHVLAIFSLTTLQTGQVGKDIPVHLDFAIGGTNSVRGWDLASEQGKNQFINTLEYRWTFWGPRSWSIKGFTADLGLQLALFGDLGIAWNQGSDFTADNFIGGYGFGLRLLIPFVNVIRIDFAFGQSGTGINRHIGLGEKADEQRKRIR